MKKIILVYILVFNYVFAVDAMMEIVNRGKNIPKILVSIADESIHNDLAIKIKNLIEKDLRVSGHFRIFENNMVSSFNKIPNVKKLKNDDVDLFLNLYLEQTSTGVLVVKVKLYDINSDKTIFNKIYSTSSYDRYPFLAHKISIATNKYLNAPTIKWMDKFIIFAQYLDARKSEIVISDYTLTYKKVVISGGLNIFPKWTDASQKSFYYTSYNGLLPVLKKYNIYTAKSYDITKSEGMLVCSDVSKTKSNIILTMAPNSQPDIYVYNFKDKIKTRLTKYKGIDVGGSFVENDTKIVFVSDRLKRPNIFAKTIGQKGVERLVYHGTNNSQCTTFNNYIVYSSRETENEFGRNAFNLYLISTQSDFIRRLTSAGRNQFPKFSEDGDSLLFIKNYKNKSYLGIIRLNYNKSFLFPLKSGKLQSIDW